MLKIEDVKVDDELVCIDRDGYINQDNGHARIRRQILSKPIVIFEITKNGVSLARPSLQIPLDSLKYFKKKEQSQQYTFDDLIDVAKKAVRDGVLQSFTFGRDFRGLDEISLISIDNPKHIFNYRSTKSGIKYIQSLYKETFVIETEEDIQKIQAHRKSDLPLLDEQMSKAILENGNEILIFRVDSESPHVCRYMRNGLYMNYLDIEVLKGATVEQERGRDD